MPPRLRNGKPAQQRRFVASTMIVCHCTECEGTQYFDYPSNQVLRGQRVTLELHKKHLQRDRRRQLALENYNAEFVVPHGSAAPQLASVEQDEKPSEEDLQIPQMLQSSLTDKAPRRYRKRLLQRPVKGSSFASQNKTLGRLQTHRQLKQSMELINVIKSDKFQRELEANPLVFAKAPGEQTSIPPGGTLEHLGLDAHAPSNYTFIRHQNALDDGLRFFDRVGGANMSHEQAFQARQLKPQLQEEQRAAFRVKKECWEQQWRIAQDEKERLVDTSFYHTSLKGMEPISCLVYLLAATLHLLANLSLENLRFLLPCLGVLLKLALHDSPNPERISIVTTIPSDVRTVIASLPIDPKFTALVCCPTCFSTYTFDPGDPSSYPEFCVYRDISGGPVCGRRLQKKVEPNTITPTQQFNHQDLPHWIGRMYSRPDIERHLGSRKMEMNSEPPKEMGDIWDASILREFLGPDGRHFMDKPDAEGRLIFGLNMDGFNPYGNKQGGKHVSICGIYLVCFNLPIEIRYQAENVFLLGIVPGPNEPSTHQVNHVLRPLVNDLLTLWSKGIYLTKTTEYPLGRPVRCALVPVICDLPAARRVAGLGGHSSGPFCSECLLHLSDINELDRSKWIPRNYDDHCCHARKWRDAESESERTRIFRSYGAKWSELLRLPYWDPTKFVVIDSMHGFYLRIFQRHIRDVWGMDIEVVDGNGMPDLNLSEEDMSEARHALRFGKAKDLEELTKAQLQQLCREAGLHYGARRGKLVRLLLQYRIAQGWFQKDGTLPESPILVPGTESGAHSLPGQVGEEIYNESQQESLSSSNPPINALQLPAYVTPPVSTPNFSHHSLPQISAEIVPELQEPTEEELIDLYHGAKSRIDNSLKPMLIALCRLKSLEYEGLNRSEMIKLIHDSRNASGVVPVRRTRRTHHTQRTQLTSQPVNDQTNQLSTGSLVWRTDVNPVASAGDEALATAGPAVGIAMPTLNDQTQQSSSTQTGSLVWRTDVNLIPSASDEALATVPAVGIAIPALTPDISEGTVTKLDHLYRSGAKSTVSRTKKYLLAVLCTMKLKGPLRHYEDMRKDQILDILQKSHFADGIVDEDGLLLNKSEQKSAVLGMETLQAIREDMEKISLPSWFTRAPKHPGEVKWGKFKADEWKAFCFVNLPITLTRLWGSAPKTDRHYKMLENFMHLVTAVKVANKRKISFEDIDLYEKHMELYLRGFVELYPFINISPYQHLSLHFPSHLRRFGPTHSWRCFAFERYNGLIQGLPANHKFGEMEKSKFIRFCRAQNLRTLYSEANLPAELHPIISLFENRYKINLRGTHSEETGYHAKQAGKATRNPAASLDQPSISVFQRWMAENELFAAPIFIASKCSILLYVDYFGQRFDATGKANSNVLFRKQGSNAGLTAGCIVSVFSYTRQRNGSQVTEIFAILREYAPLSEEDSRLDFFRRLPAAAGHLSYDVLKDNRELVPISHIITHFASSPVYIPGIEGRCLQILSLRL